MKKYFKGQVIAKREQNGILNRLLVLKDTKEDDEYIYGVQIFLRSGDYDIYKYELLKLDNTNEYILENYMVHEISCNLIINHIKERNCDNGIVREFENDKKLVKKIK